MNIKSAKYRTSVKQLLHYRTHKGICLYTYRKISKKRRKEKRKNKTQKLNIDR